MLAEAVVDASVIGAALFNEAHSAAAIAFLLTGPALTAPSLITAELTSLAAKKVWREEATLDVAQAALQTARELVDELAPCEPLAAAALELAAAHRLSAYDSLYVALAVERQLRLVTLDRQLIARVRAAGVAMDVVEPDAR